MYNLIYVLQSMDETTWSFSTRIVPKLLNNNYNKWQSQFSKQDKNRILKKLFFSYCTSFQNN